MVNEIKLMTWFSKQQITIRWRCFSPWDNCCTLGNFPGLQWSTPGLPWVLPAQNQPVKFNLLGYLETEKQCASNPLPALLSVLFIRSCSPVEPGSLSRQITTCHMIRSLGQGHRGFAQICAGNGNWTWYFHFHLTYLKTKENETLNIFSVTWLWLYALGYRGVKIRLLSEH